MSSHLAVILNPSSGANNNEDLQNRLTESFSATRNSEVRILLAGNREEIVELAERAIAEGADPIVAGGGNGTLNAVASVLVGTERTLGALPLGTLNHFAKDLNIPLEKVEPSSTSSST
jgi:diacylglycerol kinase family enzyme